MIPSLRAYRDGRLQARIETLSAELRRLRMSRLHAPHQLLAPSPIYDQDDI